MSMKTQVHIPGTHAHNSGMVAQACNLGSGELETAEQGSLTSCAVGELQIDGTEIESTEENTR